MTASRWRMTAGRGALLVLALVAAAAALPALRWVTHGFSARATPSAVEAFIAEHVRLLAMPVAARDTVNPLPASPQVMEEGRAHFADHCAGCHANDGSGGTAMGRGLYPNAPDMRRAETQALSDGALFYIIENGIRFTGMPAWGSGDPAAGGRTWALVHFIRRLPQLTAEDLRIMRDLNPRAPQEAAEDAEMDDFLHGKGD
jgi:mono/diheme cytochrome c family protein